MIVLALAVVVAAEPLIDRFPAGDGYARVDVVEGSFGDSLRHLPLLPKDAHVVAYDGAVIDPPWARAVVDLDVGTRDLQQCADSAIRLWAEHRFATRGADDDIVVHATSGDPLPWSRYRAGDRPTVKNNRIVWQPKKAAPSSTHATFRRYLDDVFLWAGSRSLERDTVAVVGDLAPGDLLVVGGSPGHVLVVLDVAEKAGAPPRLLIGQGFMPAQSFHVLGWFDVAADGSVVVPSWPAPFPAAARRRFR